MEIEIGRGGVEWSGVGRGGAGPGRAEAYEYEFAKQRHSRGDRREFVDVARGNGESQRLCRERCQSINQLRVPPSGDSKDARNKLSL